MRVSDALILGDCAKADKETLLAAILDCDRSYLLTHPEEELDEATEKTYVSYIKRRERGEPAAYITGRKEFFGRRFAVTHATLIPRPATEALVEIALKVLRGENVEKTIDIDEKIVAWTEIKKSPTEASVIADIGTGSGCIAITLACERPDLRIIATDVSEDALSVAKENARRHGVADRIDFRSGSGFDPLKNIDEPFFIVSNPPYIPEGTKLERDVADHEPHSALFAGKDGGDVLRTIVECARESEHCLGFCIECMKEQVDS